VTRVEAGKPTKPLVIVQFDSSGTGFAAMALMEDA
jgi:hypothetical protein